LLIHFITLPTKSNPKKEEIMSGFRKKTVLLIALGFLALWAAVKYLLPLLLPFLMGSLLALAAEPMVKRLSGKLPQGAATAIGVSATLILMLGILTLLAAILVRELGLLAKALPDLGQTAKGGLRSLEGFLLNMAEKTPEGVRSLLSQSVSGLFRNGSAIVEQISLRLPGIASSFLGELPHSAVAFGTGILSAFMVSARLPRIRTWIQKLRSHPHLTALLPVLRQVRAALGGWLKAQLTLILLCFLIIGTGLLLLRVPYGPVWAFFIALVDAVPILGTGTILLPWSLICLLQGQTIKAIGLVGIYVVAVLSRSILEPRLVGKRLGIDPLVTLIALYVGFQFWGIFGMLLSPMICVACSELIHSKP
jgi:sporulation integral membrane protein YtvI